MGLAHPGFVRLLINLGQDLSLCHDGIEIRKELGDLARYLAADLDGHDGIDGAGGRDDGCDRATIDQRGLVPDGRRAGVPPVPGSRPDEKQDSRQNDEPAPSRLSPETIASLGRNGQCVVVSGRVMGRRLRRMSRNDVGYGNRSGGILRISCHVEAASLEKFSARLSLSRFAMSFRLSSANSRARAPSASGPKIQRGRGLVPKTSLPVCVKITTASMISSVAIPHHMSRFVNKPRFIIDIRSDQQAKAFATWAKTMAAKVTVVASLYNGDDQLSGAPQFQPLA